MKKILAIDDNNDNLISVRAILKQMIPDCKVLLAQSGTEGIEIANTEQPDTILLDVIMPGMDGYEVCEKLKSDITTEHIPVIMLTAIKTDSKSRIRGLEIGADAFVSKPLDPHELSAQVNLMLRIKYAEDKLRREKSEIEELVAERTKEFRDVNQKIENEILENCELKMVELKEEINTLLIQTGKSKKYEV